MFVAAALAVLASGCAQQGSAPPPRREAAEPPQQQPADARTRAKARTDLAGGYYEVGNYGVALEEIRNALAADPTYAPAHTVHALIQMELRETAQAQASFQRALQLDPQDPDTQHNYGWFLCESGRIDEALERFQIAIRNPLYASPAKSFATAGLCLQRANRPVEAISRYESALRLDPNYVPAMVPLARLRYLRGDIGGARELLNKHGELTSASAESLWLALLIERRRGDAQSEASIALQLRRRFPDSRETQRLERGQYE